MKRQLFSLLLIAVLGGGFVLTSQNADATNYSLICNAMKSLTFQQTTSGPLLTGAFDAAPQKADAGALPIFSCAWHDRTLRSTEPRCVAVVNALSPEFYITSQEVGGAAVHQELSPGTQVEAGLIDAYQGAHISFSIGSTAPNNGGCFTATSFSILP